MILICGGLADSVTELVCARLVDCGYPFRFLDLGHFPARFRVYWRWAGAYPTGYIEGPDWRLDLEELTGVYVRYLGPEGRAPLPDVDPEHADALRNEADSALTYLLEYLPCLVVNRLAGGMSNNSKTFQALLVRQCGLKTPPTLVTSDPEAARRFYAENDGQVIYKSLSGVRSVVRRLQPEQLDRLALLEEGPAQFQMLIPGDNVRVHTVGDQYFATRVLSDAVDYRYARRDGKSVEMEAIDLPAPIAAACFRLAAKAGLALAGIDLKVTPDGTYYCFEINPSPGFLYYEKHTGQPISTALADLLRGGEPGPRQGKEAPMAEMRV